MRGFLSSSEIPVHIGLDSTKVDSAFFIWPDNSFQKIELRPLDTTITFTYRKGLPKYDYDKLKNYRQNRTVPVEDITAKTNILYKHKENQFNEFDREPLFLICCQQKGLHF